MRFLVPFFLCCTVLSQQSVLASPASDQLGTCLKDNTTGKDRKDLGRWMFAALAAHPEIANMSTVSDPVRVESNKTMANLVTRLLTESCVMQTRKVIEAEGPQGMMVAFKALGEVATMELMTHPTVGASVQGYTQFLDKKKLQAALGK